MNDSHEILVVGSGPAAAAAAKLAHVLGHDVGLVIHELTREIDPQILLPDSALRMLRSLGLLDSIQEVSAPIQSHEVRWERSENTEVPGADSSVQISEDLLASRFHAAVEKEGVPVVRGTVVPMKAGETARVRLEDGRSVGARFVLCSVPSLLPESLRPRVLTPRDIATTLLVEHGALERFPFAHHVIEAFPEGWAWALRLDGGRLQLTTFHDTIEGAPLPTSMAQELLGAHRAASEPITLIQSLARPIAPTLPSWEWDATIIPVGRAAFATSPLSSLGTSHALQSAYLAVALVHTRIANRGIDAGALAQWYARETMRRAFRTHALTALAGRGPRERFATDYWRARSEDTWLDEGPRDLVGAAMRSRTYVERTQAGEIDEILLQRSPSLLETTVLFQQGPIVHPRLAVMSPDGLPVDREEWSKLSRLASSFAEPSTLGRVVARASAHLADDVAKHELRKKIGRRVGRLVEAGVLEFVP